MINHRDRCISLLSGTDDMFFALFNLFTELSCAFWVIICNTLNTKEILKIPYIEQFKRYPFHQDE